MLSWILLGLQGAGILFLLWAIRSFGKWAKELLALNNTHRASLDEARNHTAVFVNLDEPPPEQKAS